MNEEVVHFYTYGTQEQVVPGTWSNYIQVVKIICTGEMVERGYGYPHSPLNTKYAKRKVTTSPLRVTCPGCLKIVLSREEIKIQMLRDNLKKAEDEAGRSTQTSP